MVLTADYTQKWGEPPVPEVGCSKTLRAVFGSGNNRLDPGHFNITGSKGIIFGPG
jgi:hypothetical protein